MITKKLKGHEQSQHHIDIFENGIIHFWSYDTLAARIVPDTETGFRWLYVSCLISPTTRRQMGWFMREYCNLSYQTARTIYNNNEWLCLDTGEVLSAS